MSEPAETIETESKELMPMEAFEAMADALRPLASGLEDFTVGSRVFSCFVAGDREDSALTKEGEHRITEMSSIAAEQARRLVDVESSHLITYLPRWCEQELSAVRALVERIAWIMYGAAEGALGPANNSPPESTSSGQRYTASTWPRRHTVTFAVSWTTTQPPRRPRSNSSTKTWGTSSSRTESGIPRPRCSRRWGLPHDRPVGEPIKADSDLAALFELIYSTGGRMPEA